MTSQSRRRERRSEALSKPRIIEAAIEILDRGGEGALTFRVLATRLATGAGAIYWHVADKGDLLAAAADHVVERALDAVAENLEPQGAVRALGLAVFDALDAHPWVGAELSREPWRPAMLRIYEGVGGRLQALGVPEDAQFDAWSTLVNYVLGVAGQNAANARLHGPDADRAAVLGAVAARLMRLDPAEHPFMHAVGRRLPGHDDREQFLAGLDFILLGIETASPRNRRDIRPRTRAGQVSAQHGTS